MLRDEDEVHYHQATHVPLHGEPEPATRVPVHGAQKEVEETVEAHERSSISARIVHKAVLEEGEEELARPTSALAWSGLAAGLSMGFSFAGEGVLHEHLPPATWRPLIATLGYTIGFIIVVIGRQQLYTENTLTAVLPVLKHRAGSVLANMLRLWSVVLIANLIGAALFALVLAYTPVADPPLHHALTQIALETIEPTTLELFVKAIPAGWLIALMVWLGPSLPGGRLWIVLILSYVVGVAGFSHVIAGSVDVMYAAFRGDASWGDYFLRFLLPVLIGNTIGGTVLVATLNHAQATSGEEKH